jgi:hypothetical protein
MANVILDREVAPRSTLKHGGHVGGRVDRRLDPASFNAQLFNVDLGAGR